MSINPLALSKTTVALTLTVVVAFAAGIVFGLQRNSTIAQYERFMDPVLAAIFILVGIINLLPVMLRSGDSDPKLRRLTAASGVAMILLGASHMVPNQAARWTLLAIAMVLMAVSLAGLIARRRLRPS